MVKVYFATNRKKDPNQPGGFGAEMVPADNPSEVLYAIAEVDRTALDDESSGVITGISEEATGGYSDKAVTEIIGAGKNLLVFIHGFDNSFADAIKRAAYNADWFKASGVPAADTTVLAFTWPSAGSLVAAPPHFPPDAYFADQAQAGKSGYHLGYFLNNIDRLRTDFRRRNPAGKVFLLAHSMGNHALEAAVQWWFDARGSDDLMFDEAVLAAADEAADTLEAQGGAQLSNLPKLAGRISVYYSRKDVAMYLSTTLNLDRRLGFDGPEDKRNETLYPPAEFRLVDCTEVTDFNPVDPPDATHQYYRRSAIVRADIATAFAGQPIPPGGMLSLPKTAG
jgi:esterase/lipase superfamily enzyme